MFNFWKLVSMEQSKQCPEEISMCSQEFENKTPIYISKTFILSAVIPKQ